MAVIHVHYPATPAGTSCTLEDELLTGMLIDHAEMLGWDQGFDPESRAHFTWQINEAASLVTPDAVSFSLWVTLSPDRMISPPFAGITACMDGLLRRLGHGAPTGFTVAVDPREARLREPEGLRVFRSTPALAPQGAGIDVVVGTEDHEFAEPLPAVGDLLTGAEDLVRSWHPAATPPATVDPALVPGCIHRRTRFGGGTAMLAEWGAAAAGALAGTVMWNAQELGVQIPMTVHVTRTGPVPSSAGA